MHAVFADTCYWIALLNPRDQTHAIAIRVSKGLAGCRIVTTEAVLNYFGSRGPYFRSAAAKLIAEPLRLLITSFFLEQTLAPRR